jgi:hypothetical protein
MRRFDDDRMLLAQGVPRGAPFAGLPAAVEATPPSSRREV